MIPLIAGISVASSVLGKIFGPHGTAPGAAPDALAFSQQMAKAQAAAHTDPTLQPSQQIQSLLAMQQATGALPPDQQFTLGKMLMQKNVQLVDASGNSVLGIVSNVKLQNGQTQITVNGHDYPVTSVKALLEGVHT